MLDDARLLVTPRELARSIEASNGLQPLAILDCRHILSDPDAGARAYAESHIPGAVHAHVDKDLSAPVEAHTGRHPLPDPDGLRKRIESWGITPDAQVVAYDDSGGAFAARAWWLLRHHGHDKVAVSDGGLAAYLDEGGPLTDQTPAPSRTSYPLQAGRMPVVDAEDLQARMPLAPGELIDAREAHRYAGETEPIDPVAGHIPGAVNVPFGTNLTEDGRFRAPDELRETYLAALGDVAPHKTAVYCGSGVTAVHNILAMELAGLHGAALYPGSWSHWIKDPDRPVATAPADR